MTSLAKLLAANASARKPKIVKGDDPDWNGDDDSDPRFDPDEDGEDASIYFYDVIGGWDQPTTEEIVRGVRSLAAKTIHLRINSPGGMVFEATAIKTALEQHPARVVSHVDGIAASAASTLMLAGDEIEIAPGGFVMIHNPASLAWGDAGEMRRCADMLDAIRDSIASQYAARTGIAIDEIAAMMAAETWLSAEDAIEKKFVDRVAARAPQAANRIRFDLSAYAHAPQSLKPPAPELLLEAQAQRARLEAKLRLFERL